jgi:large subunit ribosomal protein L18e
MKQTNRRGATNPIVASLIEELKIISYENEAPIWRRVSKILQRPNRQRAAVNLSKIERYTKEGESVIVPGKVLASGDLNRGLTIAAVAFSKTAEDKIIASNGRAIKIKDLIQENPKGSNVRIIV